MKFPLCDIFCSIQGEGRWSGLPMVFLRAWGCPLSCPWCDEPRHRDPSTRREPTLKEILAEADRLGPGVDRMLLTGGEPLALENLTSLVRGLKGAGYWLALETSGVGGAIPEEVDWVTLSPKTDLDPERYTRADELKFVIGPHGDEGQLDEILARAARFSGPVWLQPRATGDRIEPRAVARCVDWVKRGRGRLGLSLQQHKLIGIP